MLPVFIPLLLPLTIIAIPAADLILAIVRRTWNGQSPFAADRGHLHHRLLEIGHSHSRSVLIMYFWSALIAFGAVGYSVHSASLWIVLVIVGAERRRPGPAAAAALHPARPALGGGLRAAALPAPQARRAVDGEDAGRHARSANTGRRARRWPPGARTGLGGRRGVRRQRSDRDRPPFALHGSGPGRLTALDDRRRRSPYTRQCAVMFCTHARG